MRRPARGGGGLAHRCCLVLACLACAVHAAPLPVRHAEIRTGGLFGESGLIAHANASRCPPAPRAQGEALPFNATPGHSTAPGRRLLACDMAIYFKNKCEMPIQLAIRGRLKNNVDSDFCGNGAVNAGEWCSRAWFTMAPGEEAYPLRTDNTIFYFYATSSDDKGRRYGWYGVEGNGDTNYYDTSSGSPCTKGSSSKCRLFRTVRLCCLGVEIATLCCSVRHRLFVFWQCLRIGRWCHAMQVDTSKCYSKYTRGLTCTNYVDCSISNCQTYNSDASVCECNTCAPGYSGSQCRRVSRIL